MCSFCFVPYASLLSHLYFRCNYLFLITVYVSYCFASPLVDLCCAAEAVYGYSYTISLNEMQFFETQQNSMHKIQNIDMFHGQNGVLCHRMRIWFSSSSFYFSCVCRFPLRQLEIFPSIPSQRRNISVRLKPYMKMGK